MSTTQRPACCASIAVLMLVAVAGPTAELATKKALTLEVAKGIAAAAEEYAKDNEWKVIIAIVDASGDLVYFQRDDGVQTGSIRLALGKAETAAAFKRPTKVWEEQVGQGRTVVLALPGGTPFEGGVPIIADGEVIGAIGVSGMTAPQDGMIAQAGADALVRILARRQGQ